MKQILHLVPWIQKYLYLLLLYQFTFAQNHTNDVIKSHPLQINLELFEPPGTNKAHQSSNVEAFGQNSQASISFNDINDLQVRSLFCSFSPSVRIPRTGFELNHVADL